MREAAFPGNVKILSPDCCEVAPPALHKPTPSSLVADVPAMTMVEMAAEFDKLGTPMVAQDRELSVDPDELPLY